MTKRKQQLSDNDNNVTISNKRSSTSREETKYFDLIHVDLLIKILSKLSTKPMAKCRCVSKLWSSIIRPPNYNQLFPIKTITPPRLLVVTKYEQKLVFYTLGHQNLSPTRHHTCSCEYLHKICCTIGGFVCSQHITRDDTWAVITNPITGESLATPKVAAYITESRLYFGYDPIAKQFKVLCFCWTPKYLSQWKVLTLGVGGNLLWRKIDLCLGFYPLQLSDNDGGICINGVLYFKIEFNLKPMIVCFDVRSEKFSFIRFNARNWTGFCLIDYKSKLGAFCYDFHRDRSFELWILDDVEKQKWSKHVYKTPQMSFPRLELPSDVCVAGMIGSGEIVLYQKSIIGPCILFRYDLERTIITTVAKNLPRLNWMESSVYTYSNFVEDVTLM